MSMMPAIRDATADDAAAIAAIYNHYVTDTVVTFELEPVAADEMRRRMAEVAARGFPWRVGEVGGRIAGFAYVAPFRTRAHGRPEQRGAAKAFACNAPLQLE